MVTTRASRVRPTTDWIARKKPIIYIAPLQDAYRKVHDQNNKVIYIISNTGKPVSLIDWKARTPI